MEKSLELVRQLVNDFREHEKAYLSPSYQEQRVREDFINKFFAALGWDVTHARQKNPYEQEVKIENKVSTQGSQRRAEDAADKARHDHIVMLVVQMLAAKAKHAAATTESEKNRLDIQIEALDRQIDNAVYELYGLTEEERKIVEGK